MQQGQQVIAAKQSHGQAMDVLWPWSCPLKLVVNDDA